MPPVCSACHHQQPDTPACVRQNLLDNARRLHVYIVIVKYLFHDILRFGQYESNNPYKNNLFERGYDYLIYSYLFEHAAILHLHASFVLPFVFSSHPQAAYENVPVTRRRTTHNGRTMLYPVDAKCALICQKAPRYTAGTDIHASDQRVWNQNGPFSRS